MKTPVCVNGKASCYVNEDHRHAVGGAILFPPYPETVGRVTFGPASQELPRRQPASPSEAERLLRLACERVTGVPVAEQSRELADISLALDAAWAEREKRLVEVEAEVVRLRRNEETR